MSDLHLKLIRLPRNLEYTEGVLFYVNSNKLLCDTLEDRIRDLNGDGDLEDEGEDKVYGETAIPYNTYSIMVTWSPKFKREMVLVMNVPEFKGVRMHWLRTAKNSLGCIGVGEKCGEGELKNTYMTDKLVELLKKHGNKGILEIV